MKIGFIGQGFIGKNMANDFEARGYKTARYDIDTYRDNLKEMQESEVVFVAVPTPTIHGKFHSEALIDAVSKTVAEQLVVIKSTVLPGTTDIIQTLYPDRYLFHSAEFLTEKNAAYDVAHPSRNVVGYTEKTRDMVDAIMSILPESTEVRCTAKESELAKYMSNQLLAAKVILANIFCDIAQREGIDYSKIAEITALDSRIGSSHLLVDVDGGRWANGHCFPKDMEAIRQFYQGINPLWEEFLRAMALYNIDINQKTGKGISILEEVYGHILKK